VEAPAPDMLQGALDLPVAHFPGRMDRLIHAWKRLWLPSQCGGLAVCLHWHHHTVVGSAHSNLTGCRPVPLWLPSQKGGNEVCPQEHQK